MEPQLTLDGEDPTTVQTFTFPGRDGTEITAYRWSPAAAPRGLVQLTHGMGEHARRYAPLAEELTAQGFLVQAQDHRGHGVTAAGAQGVLPGGWPALVDDIGVLLELGKAEAPGVPAVLLAHSMGSFAAQQWIVGHSTEVAGLVLSGTALLDLMEPALDLSGPLDLSSFNAPFEQRTGFEWLSRDPAQVDLYVADPDCGFGLDTAATQEMFAGARGLTDLSAIRPDLPVLITVGDADPVNAGLALVHPLVDRLAAAGVEDVTLSVWPGARHEVFNETNRAEIVAALLAWLDRVVKP